MEVSFIPSKYLLIHFSSDAINNLYFLEAIKILGISYKLKGIVCCNGAHFTCVTQENNSWIYFNDLCDSLLIFPSLIQVYSHFPQEWLFGIYEISELPINRVPHLGNWAALQLMVSTQILKQITS